MSSVDDAHQQVRDVTADVSRCCTAVTEMHDRRLSPVVDDDEADDSDCGRCDLTAI